MLNLITTGIQHKYCLGVATLHLLLQGQRLKPQSKVEADSHAQCKVKMYLFIVFEITQVYHHPFCKVKWVL